MNKLRNLKLGLLSIVLFIAISGCKKDNDNNTLLLPPSTSMSMDFNFTSATKSTSVASNNHGIASGAISYWSIIAASQTLIPSAAFKKALENTPVFNDVDKLWEWKYDTKVGNDIYKSKLTGKMSADSVEWSMFISKVGDNNIINYKWFNGKSHVARTGGWWILNYPRNIDGGLISDPGLMITWIYASEQVFSLKYLSIANQKYDNTSGSYIDNDDKGGFIEYGHIVDTKYNSYYTIYSKKNLNKYDIVWNTTSKNGQIKLNGTPIGCWDELLQDQTCAN